MTLFFFLETSIIIVYWTTKKSLKMFDHRIWCKKTFRLSSRTPLGYLLTSCPGQSKELSKEFFGCLCLYLTCWLVVYFFFGKRTADFVFLNNYLVQAHLLFCSCLNHMLISHILWTLQNLETGYWIFFPLNVIRCKKRNFCNVSLSSKSTGHFLTSMLRFWLLT